MFRAGRGGGGSVYIRMASRDGVLADAGILDDGGSSGVSFEAAIGELRADTFCTFCTFCRVLCCLVCSGTSHLG
jgi:hypothetical protein